MRQDCWYTDVLLGSLVSAPGQPRSLLLTSFRHATHPGYDAAALLNDVAIVHLPRDISVGGRMMITRAGRLCEGTRRFHNHGDGLY